jgi:hypothetical protein
MPTTLVPLVDQRFFLRTRSQDSAMTVSEWADFYRAAIRSARSYATTWSNHLGLYMRYNYASSPKYAVTSYGTVFRWPTLPVGTYAAYYRILWSITDWHAYIGRLCWDSGSIAKSHGNIYQLYFIPDWASKKPLSILEYESWWARGVPNALPSGWTRKGYLGTITGIFCYH